MQPIRTLRTRHDISSRIASTLRRDESPTLAVPFDGSERSSPWANVRPPVGTQRCSSDPGRRIATAPRSWPTAPSISVPEMSRFPRVDQESQTAAEIEDKSSRRLDPPDHLRATDPADRPAEDSRQNPIGDRGFHRVVPRAQHVPDTVPRPGLSHEGIANHSGR